MLSGRLRRLKFLAYSILLWIVIAILGVLAGSLLNHARYPVMASIAVLILIALFWMWAGAALVVKRLHDLDWPGWHYVWMFLIPGLLLGGLSFEIKGMPFNGAWSIGLHYSSGTVTSLAMLYLVLARGSDGANKFGSPP
jgi:uncharacterized membrane protein YhaH (DUF805 family)